jgi:purine/pyrimidine-nucleoside phosphorylase
MPGQQGRAFFSRTGGTMSDPERFEQVSVVCKANIYFDGKVVSHTILCSDGSKKTIGLIYPGTFRFDTGVAERMAIIAGSCRARIAGASAWSDYPAGSAFSIGANSWFEITVDSGIAEYVCSFL